MTQPDGRGANNKKAQDTCSPPAAALWTLQRVDCQNANTLQHRRVSFDGELLIFDNGLVQRHNVVLDAANELLKSVAVHVCLGLGVP